MQFSTSWVPGTGTGTGDTRDIQIFPEGSQGEQATSEEGVWLRPIKGLITGLCLKGESGEELGVWIGLWMSEGATDRSKGSRNLHRDPRGRTGPHLEATGSREAGKSQRLSSSRIQGEWESVRHGWSRVEALGSRGEKGASQTR